MRDVATNINGKLWHAVWGRSSAPSVNHSNVTVSRNGTKVDDKFSKSQERDGYKVINISGGGRKKDGIKYGNDLEDLNKRVEEQCGWR